MASETERELRSAQAALRKATTALPETKGEALRALKREIKEHQRTIARCRRSLGLMGAEAKASGNTRAARQEDKAHELAALLHTALKLCRDVVEAVDEDADWIQDARERLDQLVEDTRRVEGGSKTS